MAASIKEVAKYAGVAISTVSKVLNNYPGVSEGTKGKVNEAIKELNYVPNLMASSLSSKQKRRVALVIFINNQRQAIDEINMLYLFGAINKAKELKLDVITVFSSIIKDMGEEELVDYFTTQGVSALVIYGLTKENNVFKRIIERQLFYVVTVDAPLVNERTTSVMVDHQRAQYDVAKKTIKSADNCRRVLYLAGRKDGWVTDLRLQGIRRLQKEMGFELMVKHANFSERKALNYAATYGGDFDVLVCASDLMAIGAVNGLRKLDVFRPVCGYDGITLMGYVGYRMNTVKQNFYHVSETAIGMVNELYEGHPGRAVLMEYKVMVIQYNDIIM